MADVEARLSALEQEVSELRRLLEENEISKAMRRSIDQIERGEGRPAREVAESLARKYGIIKS